ncbi:MAG: leucine-rich repeat protein [Clostridia bacterium]|nr:leucine-rich repeat protein [Clostridia bacterium]
MKSRCCVFVLLLIALLIVFAYPVSADTVSSGSCGSAAEWSLDSNGTLTISGSGEIKDYSLVYSSGGYITDAPWGNFIGSIGSVVIKEGITAIGDYAFYGCKSIKSVTLPEGLSEIGDSAFYGLSDIELHVDSLESWLNIGELDSWSSPIGGGGRMYVDGRMMEEIVIPSSITDIKEYAFEGLGGIKSIRLHKNIKYIGCGAFWTDNAFGEVDIYIEDLSAWCNVEIGGNDANTSLYRSTLFTGGDFYVNGQLLTDLVIPKDVTHIGDFQFSACTSLTRVKMHNGVTSIGAGAFFECKNLQNIDIAHSVSSIGRYAFCDCVSLQEIEIPVRTTTLSENVFENCKALTSVEIHGTMSTIEDSVFAYCTGLTEIVIPNNVKTIGDMVFSECSKLVRATLPAGINEIPYGMFSGCTKLENVNIPSSVETIRQYAFSECEWLTELVLPESVQAIEREAFRECVMLRDINIPYGVKKLEYYTFAYCDNLRTLDLPGSIGLIDECTFVHCDNLTITFLGSAPIFHEEALDYADNTTIYYSENDPSWTKEIMLDYGGTNTEWVPYDGAYAGANHYTGSCGYNAVWTLTTDGVLTISGTGDMYNYNRDTHYDVPWNDFKENITALVIEEGITNVGSYIFAETVYSNNALKRVTIPSTVSTIGYSAFLNCAGIESVTISNGLTSISDSAFEGCSLLGGIALPSTLTEIGSRAFYKCSSLTSISIPEGVEALFNDTFMECGKLETANLPDTLTEIDRNVFKNCLSLKKIYIPEGISEIPVGCFYGCKSLESIILPSSLMSIEREAFAGTALKELRFTGDVPSFTSDSFSDAKTTAYYPVSLESWIGIEEWNLSYTGGEFTWNGYIPSDVDIPISQCYIDQISEKFTYTGSEIKPSVSITLRGYTLTEGKEYTLSYRNNINAGAATAIITGIGGVFGSAERTFTIVPAEPTIYFADTNIEKQLGDASFINPVTSNGDGKTVYYSNNTAVASVDSATGRVTIRSAGSAIITVTLYAGNNYTGGYANYTLTVNGAPASSDLMLNSLSYSFSNSRRDFGYSGSYRIPLERYREFFSETVARQLYNTYGRSWNGSCYGMAVTAALFNVEGSGLTTSMFGKSSVGALGVTTHSASLGMNVTEMIETAFVGQFTDVSMNSKMSNENLSRLCAEAEKIAFTKKPLYVSVSGPSGGHALLAYKIEKVNSKTSRLYVYDCNYPKTSRYVTLYTNASGEYTGWYYCINDRIDVGSAYYDWHIRYIPYSVYQSVWQGRKSASSARNMLMLESDNFEILDYSGNVVAQMENGRFTSSSRYIFEAEIQDSSNSDTSLIYLPSDVYEIVNYDGGTLDATMMNWYQSANVSTSADSIMFAVVDADESNMVYIDGAESDTYSVTMNSELECAAGYEEMQFSGFGSTGTVALGLKNGQMTLSNCDGATVWVNGSQLGGVPGEMTKDITACDIQLEYKFTGYDGSAKEPEVDLILDGFTLKRNVDYTVIYVDNVEIGVATVAAYGIGSYSGSVFDTFEILKVSPDTCMNGHYFNRGEFTSDESGYGNGIMTYTCTICGFVSVETVRGYECRLIDYADEFVTVSFTNNADALLSGKLCIVAYDAAGQIAGFRVCDISLSKGNSFRTDADMEYGRKASSVKVFVLDSVSYAPLFDAWTAKLE